MTPAPPSGDLLAVAAGLVDVASVSHHEKALADRVEAELRGCGHLETQRVGDTVVARSSLGRAQRVVLAGHLDTVPPFDDTQAEIRGDTLWGLGAVDMKGGVAVFLELAKTVTEPTLDVTFVFYACEEIERRYNGLAQLAGSHPDLLVGDVAVLGEPTGGVVEAGCQGTMRAAVTMHGRRAHTARPWMGVNAVYRLAPVLSALAAYRSRTVVIDGCEYAEQVQAVGIEGGVAGNVVPDSARVQLNYRFAPDRDLEAAEAELRSLVVDCLDTEAGDSFEVTDGAAGAPPTLGQPVLADLVRRTGRDPRAKLGWTDVATFWQMGMPATNFGPGDPELAHTPDEHVSRDELRAVYDVLAGMLISTG